MNRIKNHYITEVLLITISLVSMLYAIFAIANVSLNVSNWTDATRGGFLFLSVVTWIIVAIVVACKRVD